MARSSFLKSKFALLATMVFSCVAGASAFAQDAQEEAFKEMQRANRARWAAIDEAERVAVATLPPRTPWVTEAREVVNLGGTNAGWQCTFTKQWTNEFIKMAGAAKVHRHIDDPVDEENAVWKPCDVPYPGFKSTHHLLNVGYYERTFTLTEAQAARNVLLSFEYIGIHYKVWINGEPAVYEPLGAGFLEQHDVSAFVRPGENTIRVMVAPKYGDAHSWIDYPLNGVRQGILRPVYLEFRNPVAIERVAMRPQVTSEKVLNAFVVLTNATAKAATVTVAGVGEPQRVEVPAGGTAEVALSEPKPDARLWTLDDPHLETATITLDNGDAYRVRYGFRELKWVGTDRKLLFNGLPFTVLRTTAWDDVFDMDENRRMIQMVKARGANGVRFPNGERKDFARFADLCDEEGFLVVTLAESGWGAGFKTDAFWPRWKHFLSRMMLGSMNNPSIVIWGLSNEFGTVYGGKDNMTNAVKQGEVGAWAEALDPTRPWEMFGEIELRWHGQEGPVAIRSYHYPVGVGGGNLLPHAGRWYERGEHGWQGAFTNDKIVSVSEDLFHGFHESNRHMMKASCGDLVYTLDGHVDAMWECIRAYAEGYFQGQIAAWDPFAIYTTFHTNFVFNGPKGSPHPVRLFALEQYNRNVTAGAETPFTLRIHNRHFEPVDGEYRWTTTLGDKVVDKGAKPVRIGMVDRVAAPFAVHAPRVREITPFTLKLELVNGGKVVQTDAFDFLAVPKLELAQIVVPKDVAAFVTDPASPLLKMKFPKGVHTNLTQALAAKPAAIVQNGPLGTVDGQRLDHYVMEGGRVLQLEPDKNDWCVATLPKDEWGRVSAYLHRRDEAAMRDIPAALMGVWGRKGHVARLAFVKPTDDARVIWESAHGDGMRWANVGWIWRGKGGWLLSTVDALGQLDAEPAATHVLRSLFNELANEASAPPTRTAVLVDGADGPVEALLDKYGATFAKKTAAEAASEGDWANRVLVFDGRGAALPPEAKALLETVSSTPGARALALNLGKDEDPAFLSLLGIRWEAPPPVKYAPVHWNPRNLAEVDPSRHFFTRIGNDGVVAGINNDDLFWWDDAKTWNHFRYRYTGMNPPYMMLKANGEPVSAYFESADPKTAVKTTPGAIGVAAGRGVVAFATFTLGGDKYAGKEPLKAFTVVKTMLNNLGARTTFLRDPAAFAYVDLAPVANCSSVIDAIEDAPPLPGNVDFRYFPVNRCGWSIAAHNYCPVDAFPTVPLNYEGVYFQFVDPAGNRGRDILFARDSKEVSYVVKLPRKMKVAKAHFLGWGMWKQDAALLRFGAEGEPVEMIPGDHFGTYAIGGLNLKHHTKRGRMIFEQYCEIPTSERPKDYKPVPTRVFLWTIENPNPDEPIDELYIDKANSLGIHAITVE
ncbi:MAG: sugar-binding domain-containing protein [Kiritimatiellia bacterium]